MKNKYQRMNMQEKKDIQKRFFSTENGSVLKKRFNRLLIIGIMGIFFSIYLLYSSYYVDNNNIFEYIIAGLLFTISLIFLIGRHLIKIKVLNNYAIRHK